MSHQYNNNNLDKLQIHNFLFLKNKFIYLFWLRWVFVAACGLFSSCGERGLLFVAVRGL